MLDVFYETEEKLFQVLVKENKKIMLPISGIRYDSIKGFERISNPQQLIIKPAHLIEFFLRAEVMRIDNLVIDDTEQVGFGLYKLYIEQLRYNSNNLINAVIVKENTNIDSSIIEFNPLEASILVMSPEFSMNDKCYIYNVNNTLIDTDSFDYVANNQGETCNFVISKETNLRDLFRDLLLFSRSTLVFSDKIKLKSILEPEVKTFTSEDILKVNGEKIFSVELTPVEHLYNKFLFNAYYNIAEDKYRKKILIDSVNDFDNRGFNNFCKEVKFSNNKVLEKDIYFTNNKNYIYSYITQVLINFTKQKVICEFETSLEKGIELEIGDNIIIYDPEILTINYTARKFLITNLEYNLTKNKKSIKIRCIENPYVIAG
jgi:hypothetical protein